MSMLPTDGSEYSEQELSEESRKASPANLLIKIESFSLLKEREIRKYKSRAFEAGGYMWILELKFYPDTGDDEGDNESGKGSEYIGVFVSMAETSSLTESWEVNAITTIFLYNHISDNYFCFQDAVGTVVKPCRFHEINSVYGSPKMISKKMLMEPRNGFLVNDTCVIGAEVYVIKTLPTIERLTLMEPSKPYKREWKIPDLSDVWTSPEFRTFDRTWTISFYPNGDDASDDRYVSIFLTLVGLDDSETVNVDCCFRIRNFLQVNGHRSRSLTNEWYKPHKDSGFPTFMKKAKFFDSSRGFVVDGCCNIDIELSVLAIGPYNNDSDNGSDDCS